MNREETIKLAQEMRERCSTDFARDFLPKSLFVEHREKQTWRNRSEAYWFWRLALEFIELGLALLGLHKHAPAWELAQISAICMNWRDMRLDAGCLDVYAVTKEEAEWLK